MNGCFLTTGPFLHRLQYRTYLVAPVFFLTTPRHGPRRQHRSFSYANRFRGDVFIETFPKSGRLFLLIKNLLPSNGRLSLFIRGRCQETNAVSEPFASNGFFSGSTLLLWENMPQFWGREMKSRGRWARWRFLPTVVLPFSRTLANVKQ
jgi:hypothetical protein